MAVGDIVSWGAYNVSAAGTTDVQPTGSIEAIITELSVESGKTGMEVYRTANGTNFTLLNTLLPGVTACALVVSNTFWLRLKNIDAGAAGNYAAGKQTK